MTPGEYVAQKRKEARHRYYLAHREDALAYQKKYNEENREKRKAYIRQYMRGYVRGELRKKIPTEEEK